MKLLLERRDKLKAEMETARLRLDEVENMIRLMRGEAPAQSVAESGASSQKRGVIKQTVLDLVAEAGEAGMSAAECIEAAQKKSGLTLDRASVASFLSRFKKDDVMIYDGTRYRLKQYAGPREAA